MDRKQKVFFGKALVILSVIPILVHAHAAGPDPSKSGAPGESTCNEAGCHVGTNLNAGGGSVKIDAGGTTYTPGVTQRINVTISDPVQRRWGFQLTARLASNSKTRAGVLASIDGNTQLVCATANLVDTGVCPANPVLQYIEHTMAGAIITPVGAGNTFHFDWTPPSTDVGNIILYAAGNAANGNTLETGDHIYTTTVTLAPAAAGSGPVISAVTDAENCSPCGGQSAILKAQISPNGFVTIKGTGLATSSREWAASDFNGTQLPTSVDGTSVKINGKDAFPSYISATQINALAPVDTATGTVSVQVTLNGAPSAASNVQMQQVTPAFILFNFDKYIAARHADATASLLGPASLFPGFTTPAKPGETILLFATGFGPTTPAIVNGQLVTSAADLASPVTINFGGVDVKPDAAKLAATGLYQFNVTVPDSAPNGDVPVVATINGLSTQSNAFITVQK
jgi:uncharacterized protein (TIGR03437 family)